MSKVFATLLGCAVLAWSAANAPGWSLGARQHADATPLPTANTDLAATKLNHGTLYVDQWLTEHAGDLADYDAWPTMDVGTPDYGTYAADNDAASPRGGGASADILLAALDTSRGGVGNHGTLPNLDTGSSFIPGFRGPSNLAFSASIGGGSGHGSSGKKGNGGQSGGKGQHGKDDNGPDTSGGQNGSGGSGGDGHDGTGNHGGKPGTDGSSGNGGGGDSGNDGGSGNTGGSNGGGGNGGGTGNGGNATTPVSVPEPGTLGLLGLGLLSLGLFRRRSALHSTR